MAMSEPLHSEGIEGAHQVISPLPKVVREILRSDNIDDVGAQDDSAALPLPPAEGSETIAPYTSRMTGRISGRFEVCLFR